MHLNLPEKLESFAHHQVNAGFYSSTSEYVRELIRKDMERNNAAYRKEIFYNAIKIADTQIMNGEGTEFDEKTMQKLGKQARQNISMGNLANNREALPEGDTGYSL